MVLELLNSNYPGKEGSYISYNSGDSKEHQNFTEKEFADLVLIVNRLSEEIGKMLGNKFK